MNENPDKKYFGIFSENMKYIIPPGLFETFDNFIALCEVEMYFNQPILIVGDTGVGKLMFLHIFKKLYEERCKKLNEECCKKLNDECCKKKKPNIAWANCAHFGGKNSDPNLARSEIFGYVGGAFPDAKKDGKAGLVEKAHEGALILEEIGKLPDEVQSMLLTFIETGEYNRLGSSDPMKAKVQVIGATNEEGALGKAFWNRFSPIYIPPLHERRQDILYYIAAIFPALIQTLDGSEVLSLLSHNWPGNVRELFKVVRLMIRYEVSAIKPLLSTIEKSRLKTIFPDFPNITHHILGSSLNNINKLHMDPSLLTYLRRHSLIESARPIEYPYTEYRPFESTRPFKDLDSSIVINLLSTSDIDNKIKDYLASLEVKAVPAIDVFDREYCNFKAFCEVFGHSTCKNKNILADLENGDFFSFKTYVNGILTTKYNRSKRLNSAPRKIDPEIHDYCLYRFQDYIDYIDYEKRKDKNNGQKQVSKVIMTEKQKRKAEYERFMAKTGGNVKKAADMAGVPNSTFRDRLKKLDIPFGKETKNK